MQRKPFMKKYALVPCLIMLSMLLSLSGCELAKGIFKAGMWVGIIIVIGIIALIIFLLRKIF